MAKFKDFLAKNRYFSSLSTTFALVASMGIILSSNNLPSVDETDQQARLLQVYNDSYITLHPIQAMGEGNYYFHDVLWNYQSVFSNRFCQQIVPLVVRQQNYEIPIHTVINPLAETKAKNRIFQYSDQFFKHPDIKIANAHLAYALQAGVSYNPAAPIASTMSCNIGSSLKRSMLEKGHTSFIVFEQSLLQSFNNILGSMNELLQWSMDNQTYGTQNVSYASIMDRAFNAEYQRLNREYDENKQGRTIPSLALKL